MYFYEYKWAATWQNQQHECAPSEDSDQPSLIWVFAGRTVTLLVLSCRGSNFLSFTPGLTMTGTEYVNQYSDIHLKCNATGVDRAPDDIDWFFNGNKIHTSHPRWYGRIEILKQKPIPGRSYISELFIHLSTMADQGNYVCRSSDLSANNMKVHVLNGKQCNRYKEGIWW